MSEFTPEEEQILGSYFTNLDEDVFVLVNLPEVVKGALFSRYSRTPKSLRRVLLEEFIQEPESGFGEIVETDGKLTPALSLSKRGSSTLPGFVATQKAESFYDRVLVGYGDDSVAELAGVHIAIENVSQMIGAKALEDNRMGISPLEKSTRYVRYDDKVNGQYRYLREPRLMKSKWADLYVQTNDAIFDTYSSLAEKMADWVKSRYPKEEGIKDWVYNSTIRAKACDICRQLLPLSTLTNVGLYGNGRSFEYLLIKMLSSPFVEVQEIARKMKQELDKVIPSFVKRSTNERGEVWQSYLKAQSANVKAEVRKLRMGFRSQNSEFSSGVQLVDYEVDGEDKVLAGMVYSLTNENFEQVLQKVKVLKRKEKAALAEAYCSGRQNRHHKLGRALEMTDYIFDVVASIGCYKDLQRHRVLTPMVQSYHPYFGYDVPTEILEAGYEKEYRHAMDQAAEAFEKIAGKVSSRLTPPSPLFEKEGGKLLPLFAKEREGVSFPLEAQYVIPLGYKMRWMMKMNLREVSHMSELRSAKQGHPHYRVVAQQMADRVREVHPLLAQWALQFVDYENVELERLESEKKIEAKKEKLSGSK